MRTARAGHAQRAEAIECRLTREYLWELFPGVSAFFLEQKALHLGNFALCCEVDLIKIDRLLQTRMLQHTSASNFIVFAKIVKS